MLSLVGPPHTTFTKEISLQHNFFTSGPLFVWAMPLQSALSHMYIVHLDHMRQIWNVSPRLRHMKHIMKIRKRQWQDNPIGISLILCKIWYGPTKCGVIFRDFKARPTPVTGVTLKNTWSPS